jgi:hypothetical protein
MATIYRRNMLPHFWHHCFSPVIFLLECQYSCVFAVWNMNSHMINIGPTNASKYQCITRSTLVHFYMFRRFKAPSSGSSVWACWIGAQSRDSITGWCPSQPPHRRSQYTALILLCSHDFGQQFSRLTLNSLKMAPWSAETCRSELMC